MQDIERLDFHYAGTRSPLPFEPVLVGVVSSGNLEVLVEHRDAAGCSVDIETSARGFGEIWRAVIDDFQARHALAGIAISVHDMGATPAVVALRLDQAASSLKFAE